MWEIEYFLGTYPLTHYVLIAVTMPLCWFAETRDAGFRDKAAAGCASALFCVSVFDFEYAWAGTFTRNIAEQILAPVVMYPLFPITNCAVIYCFLKNLLGTNPVRAWCYTLLCLVQMPVSAFLRYIAH